MKIIVVGCGKVGATLVEQLSREGHDLTIIDVNESIVSELSTTYDVLGLTGSGASYSLQQEAGVESADLMIAVTDSDELNLLCCTLAKKAGNCATIARVRNPDYTVERRFLRQQLGLSMIINPELEAATEIARLLRLPTALDISSFAKGAAELIKFKIPQANQLHGKTLAEAAQSLQCDALFCAVERGRELTIPSGSFELREGDLVSVLVSARDSRSFFGSIGVPTHQVASTMIVGGGKSSYYLAKQLTEMGINVKIIEQDARRCRDLSELLPRATILRGDGTDELLLQEEGILSAESFVPLTGLDEENILLTLYARRVSNCKVITKLNRVAFHDVIAQLDLGSVVYPRFITAETIIAYVRALQNSIGSNIETLYKLFDDRAEAAEFCVGPDAPVCGKPLAELSLKDNLLIACINRGGKIIIPRGSDCIQADDTVIVVTTNLGLHDIRDILR
ncbi:MAG: Trk system potassium transporter TrkA [Oscillospiraceae bacterium]|nr:Trk system potassium transporter TrkA [Oscillospiraceae bacterium]